MNEHSSGKVSSIVSEIQKVLEPFVLGQGDVVRLLTGALLVGGHVLLEGPPGVGKTLLAKSFASAVGMSFNRIQFTPDLMPSDIVGVSVFDQRTGDFRFVPGPIQADIVLADEVNRTPPKTQAALLEAMEERSVTVDGKRHTLHDLFFVIATQNPVEHEGTFPLPEAQLDRFLFKLEVSYPPAVSEQRMIIDFSARERSRDGTVRQYSPDVVAQIGTIREAALEIRQVALSESVADYIYRIVQATRLHKDLLLGASPRAALHLALASKFNAASQNRTYVLPDDIQLCAGACLGHRLIFRPEAFERASHVDDVLKEIVSGVSVPDKIAP